MLKSTLSFTLSYHFKLNFFFSLMFDNSAEMLKCSPPPLKRLSKYAPLIHIMKVCLSPVELIILLGKLKLMICNI